MLQYKKEGRKFIIDPVCIMGIDFLRKIYESDASADKTESFNVPVRPRCSIL